MGNSRSVRDGYCSGTVSWNDVGLDAELNCLGVADYTYTGQGRSRSGLKPRRALAPRRTRLARQATSASKRRLQQARQHKRSRRAAARHGFDAGPASLFVQKYPQRTSGHVERQVTSVDPARCSKKPWRTETPRLFAGRQHDTESFACSFAPSPED